MVSLRQKAVKRILLSLTFLFCQDGLLLTGKRADTSRTERIFARKFAEGKFEKSELSLEKSERIIG